VALSGVTKLYGVADVKIFPLTADSDTATTYGTAIDVPGIQDLKMTPNYVEKSLQGDDATIESDTKLSDIDFTVQHAKISLEVLEVIEGGTITESGSTPNQVKEYLQTTASKPEYFKLEAQVRFVDTGAADVHMILHKCKAGKVDVEVKGDDYAVVSFSGKAIGTLFGGKVKSIKINETEAAIA
jgi:hypothetical protein